MRRRDVRIYKITSGDLERAEIERGVMQMPPVMGNEFTAAEYFDRILDGYNHSGKLLSPMELGCSLSHLKIYEALVASNVSGIILEDDMVASANELNSAVELCSQINIDFIHLGWHPGIHNQRYFWGRKVTAEPLFRVNPYRDFYGAYAYCVSPFAARALIDFHSASINRADAWKEFFHQSDIEPYFSGIFAHPAARGELDAKRRLVTQSVQNLDSHRLVEKASILLRQQFSKVDFRFKEIKPGSNDLDSLG